MPDCRVFRQSTEDIITHCRLFSSRIGTWKAIFEMKQTQIYQHLVETAGKLDIRVTEQNLRVTGVNAKSGLCRIRGESVFIMDKRLSVNAKITLLAECLRQMPLEEIYIMPAVRKILDRKPNQK